MDTSNPKYTKGKMWEFCWLVSSVISILVGFIFTTFFGIYNGLFTASATFFAVISIIIISGWTMVPHMEIWIVEFLGSYFDLWKPGLHIRFPFFMRIKKRVLMSELMLVLFKEEINSETEWSIEFRDGKGSIFCTLYWQILDSYKAVYGISNIESAITEKMEAAVRTYLGKYCIDEAIKLKTHFDLKHILNGETVGFEPNTFELRETEKEKKLSVEESELFRKIKDEWGVEIKNIVISDIMLPKELEDARNTILTASKKKEAAAIAVDTAELEGEADRKKAIKVAEGQKRVIELTAEGKKKAISLEGEGMKEKIEQLKKAGLYPQQAVEYDVRRIKYEKGVEITEIGNLHAGQGASFGAGFNSQNKKNRKEEQAPTKDVSTGTNPQNKKKE